MELNLSTSKLSRLALLIIFIFPLVVQAQETKGGSVKGGGGSSSFRESIESFKRQQQQILPISQTNIVKESVSSFSSSIAQQRPVTVGRVVSEQQEEEQQQQQLQQNSIGQPEPASYGGVAGTPGIDFPNYVSIPNTKFNCDGLPFNPGMYADESTGCQVYHLCYQGRKESFLCGIGTVFNQAIMNCDFWHSVDCSKSSRYYHLNADFGKSLGEPAATLSQQQVKVSGKQSSSQVVKTQTSNFVQAPIVVSSTALLRQQQSSLTRNKQIVNRPSAAIKTTQSNSELSFSGLSSGPGQSANEAPAIGLFDGKTSARRQELSARIAGGGLLSPARQQRFNQNQLDGSSGQFTSESSTRLEVMSSTGMQLDKSGQSSISVGSALVVTDDGTFRAAQQDTLERPTFGASKRTASKIASAILTSGDDSGGWKPYFRSKANSKVGSTKSASPSAQATSSATATTSTSPRPTEVAIGLRPDEEPVFSSEVAKKFEQTTRPTARPPIGSAASIEPDVGLPVVATTEEPSQPSSTTTTPPADVQAQSESPDKSERPPPSTIGSSSGEDAATPGESLSSKPSADSTTPAAESPTTAQSGETTIFPATIGTVTISTTAAPPTTIKNANSSSVEYAASGQGEQPAADAE